MGVYPDGLSDWEVREIEKFRDVCPELYEWRKGANLLPEIAWRPVGESIPLANSNDRHPELVSGSILQRTAALPAEEWMLKQVQHDGQGAGQ